VVFVILKRSIQATQSSLLQVMLFLTLIVALFAVSNAGFEKEVGMTAGGNETQNLGSCSYTATCTAGGIEGVCVSISAGCCSGTRTSGICPGSSDIQCCTSAACSTPYGTGTCKQASACSGKSYSGYCVGPSDLQCCVSGTPTPTTSVYGIDISSSLSASTASCLAGTNSFVIPRGYKSTGAVDTAVCTSIINAANNGFKTRDTYMFPCPTCSSSASSQVSQLTSYLNSNCKSQWSGRIWLDIEGSQYWTGSTSSNQAWYKQLKDACKSSGARCGVYSSASQWSAIFGSTSWSYGSGDLPLWYAHYDNNPSFSDFSAFGGWSVPYVKQYQGDVTACSLGVDKNYAPVF
jgi:GH25 family lysozyme M1 (1,4-beta-N-acetylmuramidase)